MPITEFISILCTYIVLEMRRSVRRENHDHACDWRYFSGVSVWASQNHLSTNIDELSGDECNYPSAVRRISRFVLACTHLWKRTPQPQGQRTYILLSSNGSLVR